MTAPADSSNNCPACGASVAGNFCSECGSALNVSCITCGTQLQRSGRFCQECGAPAPTSTGRDTGGRRVTRRRQSKTRLNAIVATLGLSVVVVLISVQIGRRTTGQRTESGATQQGMVISAPDISSMSPRERAARLYDRVMRLHEQRKTDSIAFFAPMALGAYAEIPDIDDDARYDMARIAMIAGALPVAQAQDDTILRRNPTHLLGLILADDLARSTGADSEAARVETKFLEVAPRERRRHLPEYDAHANEIESTLRRLGKGP